MKYSINVLVLSTYLPAFDMHILQMLTKTELSSKRGGHGSNCEESAESCDACVPISRVWRLSIVRSTASVPVLNAGYDVMSIAEILISQFKLRRFASSWAIPEGTPVISMEHMDSNDC